MAIYRVVVGITWNGEGSPGVNVWHYRTESVLSEEDLEDGLDTLRTFYDSIKTIYPNGVQLTLPVDVVRVDTDPPESVPFTSTTVNGTGGTIELSELLQLCVSWKTSVRTRSGSGRTFLGPLEYNAAEADGTPKNAVVTMVKTAAAALIITSGLEDSNGAWGVYSRTQGVIRDFTGLTCDQSKFAVLKSRRD